MLSGFAFMAINPALVRVWCYFLIRSRGSGMGTWQSGDRRSGKLHLLTYRRFLLKSVWHLTTLLNYDSEQISDTIRQWGVHPLIIDSPYHARKAHLVRFFYLHSLRMRHRRPRSKTHYCTWRKARGTFQNINIYIYIIRSFGANLKL